MINKNNKILLKGQAIPPPAIADKEEPAEHSAGQQGNNFWPGGYFLRHIKYKPFRCLLLIYDASTLRELSEIWNLWEKCAICAPYSAFSENGNRRYLLQFAEHFRVLTEALHFILVLRRKEKGKKLYAIEQAACYKYAWNRQLACAIISDFARRYSQKRAAAYLWSVFECALAEENIFKIERKNILFDYECLLCMAKAPHRLLKHYAALFEIS